MEALPNNARFSLFAGAISDLEICKKYYEGNAQTTAVNALAALRQGQRFYLPVAKDVIAGKLVDDDIKALLHIPFDQTVILSEVRVHGRDGAMFESWNITIGIDPKSISETWAQELRSALGCERVFCLVSLTVMPGIGARFPADHPMRNIEWTLNPAPAFISFPEDDQQRGYILTYGGEEELRMKLIGAGLGDPVLEFQEDANRLMNLCILLNLENVEAHQVNAPNALNKSRIKNGKQPLPDYKVLKVDGEVWDSPYDPEGGGPGKRSHLRRGHIRRLGEKRVWVRATYVKGSQPGFVKKDYEIE